MIQHVIILMVKKKRKCKSPLVHLASNYCSGNGRSYFINYDSQLTPITCAIGTRL